MLGDFVLFGPSHWVLIAAMPLLVGLLAWISRGNRLRATRIAAAVGAFLLCGEATWYVYLHAIKGDTFPYGMPCQLCAFSAIAAGIAGITRRQWPFEFAYYLGTAGAAMAMLTPEPRGPVASYPIVYFFISHGLIVGIPLFLVLTGLMRPQPGSLRRAVLFFLAAGAVAGTFDWATGANYMYLCQKPGAGSLFDVLGPWPVYLLSALAIAGLFFTLLWLPFRINKNGHSA